MSFVLGIDPGFKNLGYALLKNVGGRLEIEETRVYNPSSFDSEVHFAKEIAAKVAYKNISHFTIERFVPFGGQTTGEAEFINIIIGSLLSFVPMAYVGRDDFPSRPIVTMVRSIEWKTALVKALVKKKGFDNPSHALDKKFSFAAAAACLDKPIEGKITDHEADAIAIAAFPILCGTP